MLYTAQKLFNPEKGYPCVFRNWRASSHCRFFHGYDLVFSVTFACEEHYLTEEGWVVDFGGFRYLKDMFDEHFDHKTIVAEDDPLKEQMVKLHEAGGIDMILMPATGCEAYSRWLYGEAQKQLKIMERDRVVRVLSAVVHEHGANMGGVIP